MAALAQNFATGGQEHQKQRFQEYLRQLAESGEQPDFYKIMQLAGGNIGGPMPENYKQLLEHIKSGDEIQIMQAVMDLSTELSMAQETAISQQTLEQFIQPLLNCLKMASMPDIIRILFVLYSRSLFHYLPY